MPRDFKRVREAEARQRADYASPAPANLVGA